MIEFRTRKVQKIGGTLWMSLPMEWVKHHQLQRGQKLKVKFDDNDYTIIVEPKVEND